MTQSSKEPGLPPSDTKVIGHGLLRLLAGSWMLHFLVRRRCWMEVDETEKELRSILRNDYVPLNNTLDDIAHVITECSVFIPTDPSAMLQVSSVTPLKDNNERLTTVEELITYHAALVGDIDALGVMLPLANRCDIVALLARCRAEHEHCRDQLIELEDRTKK